MMGDSDAQPLSRDRIAAYTTARTDVLAMVPAHAMRVLDVGCSNGALGRALRAQLDGRRVEGIEGAPLLAAEAEKYLDRVICADLNRLAWSDVSAEGQYDCIIFADVLEHLVDPWSLLREALLRLRSGGCVVISLPNVRHVTAFVSIFLRGTFPRRDRGIFDSTHLRWFTLKDALNLIEQSGLRVTAMDSALRLKDKGGGFLNKLTIRAFDRMRNFYPIREFLTYQFTIQCVKS
jgi:2-polyprenyl-3-methyl-5-hydroxy-6-metoxy-1,4-benzoquinol methylase